METARPQSGSTRRTSRQGVTIPWHRVLRYYPTPKKPRRPIIAVDIETDGLGGAFLLGAYVVEGDETVRYFTSIEEWVIILLSKRTRGYTWYAHNGGEYDYKYLLSWFTSRLIDYPGIRIQPIVRSDQCIGLVIRYHKQRIEVRDSFALVPTSLKAMTVAFAPQYQKQDIGLAEGVRFNPDDSTHRAYLEMDVFGLLHSLQAFFTIISDTFGVPCGWTIGSTALRAWRHTLDRDKWYWRLSPAAEGYIRQAYYGGLVFLTSTAPQTDCVQLDVNSMYPSMMRAHGVPCGIYGYVQHRYDGPAYYHALAHVPDDMPFTFVPHRTKTGVTWPTGTFDTFITSVEMETAEKHGVTFEVIDGYLFDHLEYPFAAFVDKCEGIRREHKGTALEAATKLLQNSLYGKFGANSMTKRYELSAVPLEDAGYTPVIDTNTGEMQEGLYEKDEPMQASYIHPEWAAWITAHARCYLAETVYRLNPRTVWYGDTDSVICSERDFRRVGILLGGAYGAFKVERRYSYFRAGGPKNYIGLVRDTPEYVQKHKGIPRKSLSVSHHMAALDGTRAGVFFESVTGTLSVLKHNAPYAVFRKRAYSQLSHSIGWREVVDGVVRPIHIGMNLEENMI